MKNREEFTQTNRIMWNETAAVHQNNYVDNLLTRISAPDYCTFDAVEKRLFAQIDLCGKNVVQPSCNNARELITVKKARGGGRYERMVYVPLSEAEGSKISRRRSR